MMFVSLRVNVYREYFIDTCMHCMCVRVTYNSIEVNLLHRPCACLCVCRCIVQMHLSIFITGESRTTVRQMFGRVARSK